jgi:hypothetical protein
VARILRENTLAVSGSGSGQIVNGRSNTQLERKLNMQRLALAFHTLTPKEYLQRAIAIMTKCKQSNSSAAGYGLITLSPL